MGGLIAVVILLGIAAALMVKGMGMLTGFGEVKDNKGESSTTGKRVITIAVIAVIALLWLSQPGADRQMAGTFDMAWGNFVRGIQPLVSAATEIGAIVVAGYLIYLFLRNRWR